MWEKRKRELHTIVGRSGSGKTALLRALQIKTDRALVFDCFGNFDTGLLIRSQSELWHYLNQYLNHFRIIYRPAIDVTDRDLLTAEINYLCRIARAVNPCGLFLDELDTFCDATSLPAELDILIRYGRNIEVSLHAAVRRPKAVIPRHYVTETTRFSIFRCVDPSDGAFLEDFTGIPREKIQALPELRFIDWLEGDWQYKQIKIHPDRKITITTLAGISLPLENSA